MEWFTQHPWGAWLALALILGATEMLTVDLTLLMLAIGALAGGVTALFVPGLLLAQVIVAVAVALISLFVLRPPLLRRVREAKGYRSTFSKMVGSEGAIVRAISPGMSGEARISGDTWTVRAWEPDLHLYAGQRVEVVEVDGVTAIVRPLPDELPGGHT